MYRAKVEPESARMIAYKGFIIVAGFLKSRSIVSTAGLNVWRKRRSQFDGSLVDRSYTYKHLTGSGLEFAMFEWKSAGVKTNLGDDSDPVFTPEDPTYMVILFTTNHAIRFSQ